MSSLANQQNIIDACIFGISAMRGTHRPATEEQVREKVRSVAAVFEYDGAITPIANKVWVWLQQEGVAWRREERLV